MSSEHIETIAIREQMERTQYLELVEDIIKDIEQALRS